MIRIKDYIFNENEIEQLQEISNFTDDEEVIHEKVLQVCRKTKSDFYMLDTTFEDIEWNYGNTELEELKLDYSAVVTGYKKLEEENKKLKFAMQDTYVSANDTCGELQQRIDKIKEYIKENEKEFGSLLDNEKIILKIIDGE